MLIVDGLVKHYGKTRALAGVDLSVSRGETVVVTGSSGCGKTTLLRCIVRLVEPDAGRVTFESREIMSLPYPEILGVRRRIGFVFQRFNLIARLSALDNVALPLVGAGASPDEARERARRALERVGLSGSAARRRPAELSGGEAQRVGIARALVTDPVLMLWDEPTASLDPILVGEVLDVMEDLARVRDTAMIVVTHEMRFALRAADRLVLLERGAVAEEGPPGEVFANPRSETGRKYRRLLQL
ncbi:MAG: ATP-binding cassette domain-containing protein [Firmicutes bacterium]|nr:ATP-binding cassette domain-containing protein [Bacillota bacterium]MDH7494382.1 ATP-binding cassette domain-containing protein [Bacillota bacterium]